MSGAPAGVAAAAVITNSGSISGGITGVMQQVFNTGTIDGGANAAINASTTATVQ